MSSNNIIDRYAYNFDDDPVDYDYYTKQLALTWTDNEYKYEEDAKNFENTDELMQRIFISINSFFLIGDGKISSALVGTLNSTLETEGMSHCAFLAVQIANEMVHATSYSRAARTIMGEEKLKNVLNEISTLPCILNKTNFISEAENLDKYTLRREESSSLISDIDILKAEPLPSLRSENDASFQHTFQHTFQETKLSIGRKYVRLACGEGVFFVTQFALLGYFRFIGIFKNFCALNDHIFADEMLHAKHKCYKARKSLIFEDYESAREDIRTAYKLETEFLKYILRNGVPQHHNISYEMLCNFAKKRCNDISQECGLGIVFGDVNYDFPGWMQMIGGQVKNNFFEFTTNSNYKITTSDASEKMPRVVDINDDSF